MGVDKTASAAMAIVNRIEAPNMINDRGADKARSKAGETAPGLRGPWLFIQDLSYGRQLGSYGELSVGKEMNRIIITAKAR